MENKTLISIGAGIVFLFLIGLAILNSGILGDNSLKNFKQDSINLELEKYRVQEIPEDCRLPVYESDVEWWKQHLSHHKQTWYCLEYYGTSIEELNGN